VGGKGGGGWGQGGEMTQALYAHMNNKRKKNGQKYLKCHFSKDIQMTNSHNNVQHH
jgi:hypothetical protein